MVEKERVALGLPSTGGGALHMVFAGNPGTGKTTVARIVANLLRALGVLRRGHLVEADRSSLVAGYSGQTALKTKAVVAEALGGVLFVDEAYALVSGDRDSFGKEALDTLMKEMEDHREDLVVIAAGYIVEMKDLLQQNPGMESRFPTTLHFADYTAAVKP
jgi:stage V sporulation protein K